MISFEGLKDIIIETARVLRGYDRRHFMAGVVQQAGRGGQRWAEDQLGWNRGTIRKGLQELNGEFCYLDNFGARSRKRAEEHLPNLLEDLKDIVDRFWLTKLQTFPPQNALGMWLTPHCEASSGA